MSSLSRSLIVCAGVLLASFVTLVPRAIAQGPSGDTQQPVNVKVVNTAGAPALVREIEQPYTLARSAYNLNGGIGSEVCSAIPVPERKRLALETVAVNVTKNLSFEGEASAHILILTSSTGGAQHVTRLAIPPVTAGSGSGHLRTYLISGPLALDMADGVDGETSFALCAAPYSAVSGLVVGKLLPRWPWRDD